MLLQLKMEARVAQGQVHRGTAHRHRVAFYCIAAFEFQDGNCLLERERGCKSNQSTRSSLDYMFDRECIRHTGSRYFGPEMSLELLTKHGLAAGKCPLPMRRNKHPNCSNKS